MKKIIFVLGTGRSGTHLLGRAISSHSEIEGHIEDPRTFHLATRIATEQDLQHSLKTLAMRQVLYYRYGGLLKQSSKDLMLEKTHPNIWLAEHLAQKFPQAKFVGIYRGVYPTVSSMLLHDGVMGWYEKLPQNKVNRFLGITKNNVDYFDELPIESKCALRWKAHKDELNRLKSVLGDRFKLYNYEEFVKTLDRHQDDLADYLGIDNEFDIEPIKIESLDKWKSNLDEEQLENIDEILREQELAQSLT